VRCSAVYPWTPNVATRGVLTHLENTKNHFLPGLRPGPRWGSSRRSPRPSSRLGRGIPPPHFPPLRRLDSMCSSTSIECPAPNGFCWRRAWATRELISGRYVRMYPFPANMNITLADWPQKLGGTNLVPGF